LFFVRPIARDDVAAVLALSERTGAGLTTLPANRERLASRIERSLASFAGTAKRADECYMFVLADGGDGRVVGISAIEAAVGLTEPWYNYHVGTLVHASRALDVYTAAPTLFLANDHTGHTELCSLFLDQAYRHGRNGALLAKSRLLFIAEFAARFAPKVIAELRGRLDSLGHSPFWEGLGRHFFAMEYTTADYLTGIGQKSFIAELMPRHPVYVHLLPEAARAVIGAVHDDTVPARAMLEQEGFRYEGLRRHLRRWSDGRMLPRQHRRRASLGDAAGDHWRGGSGAGQPDRRHPLAGRESPVRRISRRGDRRPAAL
jgi:arginine N-succinyltransferase